MQAQAIAIGRRYITGNSNVGQGAGTGTVKATTLVGRVYAECDVGEIDRPARRRNAAAVRRCRVTADRGVRHGQRPSRIDRDTRTVCSHVATLNRQVGHRDVCTQDVEHAIERIAIDDGRICRVAVDDDVVGYVEITGIRGILASPGNSQRVGAGRNRDRVRAGNRVRPNDAGTQRTIIRRVVGVSDVTARTYPRRPVDREQWTMRGRAGFGRVDVPAVGAVADERPAMIRSSVRPGLQSSGQSGDYLRARAGGIRDLCIVYRHRLDVVRLDAVRHRVPGRGLGPGHQHPVQPDLRTCR